MSEKIGYELPTPAVEKLAHAVTTSEADVVVLTDRKYLDKSQITVYIDATLGSATSIKFRYYYSPDSGTTWFRVPVKNTSTGLLADIPTVIDATSPTVGSDIQTIEDFGLSGSLGFKVTAQSVAASATLNRLAVFTRDN